METPKATGLPVSLYNLQFPKCVELINTLLNCKIFIYSVVSITVCKHAANYMTIFYFWTTTLQTDLDFSDSEKHDWKNLLLELCVMRKNVQTCIRFPPTTNNCAVWRILYIVAYIYWHVDKKSQQFADVSRYLLWILVWLAE